MISATILSKNLLFGLLCFVPFTLLSQDQLRPKRDTPKKPATILKPISPQVSKTIPDSPHLKLLKSRAQLVLKNNATYWKGVTDGSIVPWSELREEWPKHVATVAKLQKDHAAILNETDPKKREALSVPFFSALQLIGPYLQASDYRNTDLSLTPDEAKELDALESADIGPAPPDPNGKTLQALTPTEVFTLLDFSVPLEIKGPPETEVFLSSGGGGVFENNLTMQRLKTDKQGLARSSWVSRGDSVGLSMITATSPACGNELAWQIEVVHLALMPLPPLPKTPVVK